MNEETGAAERVGRGTRIGIFDWCLVVLFAGIVVLVLVAVVFRYLLNHSLYWSDEVVRYLFVWFIFLGAALTLRDRGHIRVEYFVERFPALIRKTLERATLVVVAVFSAFLCVSGFLWVYDTRGTYTSALGLPLNLVFYGALPVTALLGTGYAIARILRGEYAEIDAGAPEKPEPPEGDRP